MLFCSAQRPRRAALVVGTWLTITCLPVNPAHAQAEQLVKDYVATARAELVEAKGIAAGFNTRASVAIGVTITAAMLSLACGLVPQVKKKWTKTAALALGFLAGTTTIVNNNVLAVDPGLLQENAYDLELAVSAMTTKLDTFGTIKRTDSYEQDLVTWHTGIVLDMGKFRDRRDELRRPARRRPAPEPAPAMQFFATLHAQAARQTAGPPSWVRQAPREDSRFVYFVGTGIEPDSLTASKDLSTRDAFRQAEAFLAGKAGTCPTAALRDRAAAGAEIVDTYFTEGTVERSNMRAYTYSTLLRLTKALADPAMLRAFAAGRSGETTRILPSRVATPRQFGGRVGVLVGPAAGTPGTLARVLVFSAPNVATRWPPTKTVRYDELKKALTLTQILQDVTLGKCGETAFRSGAARYWLTLMEVQSGSDRAASVAIAAEKIASARN